MKFASTRVVTYYSWSNTKIVVKVTGAPYGKLYVKVVTTGGDVGGQVLHGEEVVFECRV